MASAIMHLCIAKKVNEFFKFNDKEIYLGAIAPDISKQIGRTRESSHFGKVPDLDLFLNKYPNFIKNDFEIGYYIHLYSDVIWNNYSGKRIYNSKVKFLNGDYLIIDNSDIPFLLYNDYTNLNIDLVDHYRLPLDIFYEELVYPQTDINEIPIENLDIIVDKMGIILANSKKEHKYVFDLNEVIEYIDCSSKEIIEDLKNRI